MERGVFKAWSVVCVGGESVVVKHQIQSERGSERPNDPNSPSMKQFFDRGGDWGAYLLELKRKGENLWIPSLDWCLIGGSLLGESCGGY